MEPHSRRIASAGIDVQITAVSEEKAQVEPPVEQGSMMADILPDALVQDQFAAKPMLKTPGRGLLKSRGVEGLKQDANELRTTPLTKRLPAVLTERLPPFFFSK